jgi:N6-adenosine-specific RNA methylase IME4
MNELTKIPQWYTQLLEDLRKLEYTGIVVTKWQIGKRIVQEELKFGQPEYGSKRIENLAKDLKTSSDDLWACIRFYKKYLDGVQQLEGKSWREIWHKYLPKLPTKKKIPQLPPGKYNIIYADPPWKYYASGYKNQEQHYDSLTMEELKQMPIDDLTADNCVLFLWVTFPILNEVFNLIKWWGFDYSTVGFVWVKAKKDGEGFFFGLGNWTRSNVELCLIATKGSIERKDASISQIIYSPIEEHSKKPAIVREKIIQLVGDLPRIELFARQKIEGWNVWGNEV